MMRCLLSLSQLFIYRACWCIVTETVCVFACALVGGCACVFDMLCAALTSRWRHCEHRPTEKFAFTKTRNQNRKLKVKLFTQFQPFFRQNCSMKKKKKSTKKSTHTGIMGTNKRFGIFGFGRTFYKCTKNSFGELNFFSSSLNFRLHTSNCLVFQTMKSMLIF